jgi:hypothetical protein
MMYLPTHTIFPLYSISFKYFPDPHKFFPDPSHFHVESSCIASMAGTTRAWCLCQRNMEFAHKSFRGSWKVYRGSGKHLKIGGKSGEIVTKYDSFVRTSWTSCAVSLKWLDRALSEGGTASSRQQRGQQMHCQMRLGNDSTVRCWMKTMSGTYPANSYLHRIKKVDSPNCLHCNP